ncbi:MAG: DUF3090 family protein [Dermatophilaceae bacterium]
MPVFEFERPERFVAGTVGPPGGRTFFLQARDGRRLVTVSCEKEQLAVLADRLDDLLDEHDPDLAVPVPADEAPLETPIDDEFRVTSLSLGWDPTRSVVVLTAEHEDESGEASGTDAVRLVLSPAQARGFARRTKALVGAGRPPCPFCGGPLDPSGHVCPRSNGYRR